MPFDPDRGKQGFALQLWRLRASMRERGAIPSQSVFASRFGLSFGAVKDAEQGRVQPSPAMRVLVAAIELDRELIERAAALAAERRREEQEGRKRCG